MLNVQWGREVSEEEQSLGLGGECEIAHNQINGGKPKKSYKDLSLACHRLVQPPSHHSCSFKWKGVSAFFLVTS